MAFNAKIDRALEICLTTSMDMLQSALQIKKKDYTGKEYYDVINKHDNYEERFYPSAVCVCTLVTDVYQDAAKTEAFRTLQNYVRGQNEEGAFLTMHPPILTQVISDSSFSFERKFIVCSYLSDDVNETFPKPTDPNVFIKTLPDMTVFVKTFKGLTSDERWTQESRNFTETIKQRENIRTDFYITATYDSPFHLVSNRNEIWLLKYDSSNHKALAGWESEKQIIQIGSSKIEVPSILSWCLYALFMYFSLVMFIIKSVFNTGEYTRKNWSSIKRHGQSSIKQAREVVTWDNFRFVTKMGMGASKFFTRFLLDFGSAFSKSAGISFKDD